MQFMESNILNLDVCQTRPVFCIQVIEAVVLVEYKIQELFTWWMNNISSHKMPCLFSGMACGSEWGI